MINISLPYVLMFHMSTLLNYVLFFNVLCSKIDLNETLSLEQKCTVWEE